MSQVSVTLPVSFLGGDELPDWIDPENCWFVESVSPNGTAVKLDYQTIAIDEMPYAWDYYYTGGPCKPSPNVYYYGKKLKKDVDYTISYKNNVKAYKYSEGEKKFDKKKAPSMTITLKGNCSGKKTYYFKISPAEIT